MERDSRYAVPLVGTARRYVVEWARKAKDATASRDRWIRAMRDEGASLREIAEAAGTTAPTIDRILRKGREGESDEAD